MFDRSPRLPADSPSQSAPGPTPLAFLATMDDDLEKKPRAISGVSEKDADVRQAFTFTNSGFE